MRIHTATETLKTTLDTVAERLDGVKLAVAAVAIVGVALLLALIVTKVKSS